MHYVEEAVCVSDQGRNGWCHGPLFGALKLGTGDPDLGLPGLKGSNRGVVLFKVSFTRFGLSFFKREP